MQPNLVSRTFAEMWQVVKSCVKRRKSLKDRLRSVGVQSGAEAGSVGNAHRSFTFQGSDSGALSPPSDTPPPPSLSLIPMILLCLFVFG